MNELISVIINVYNGEKFINKCIESVINQTYKNLEILIINDGSTDNTLSLLKKYKDKRIRIITTENLGLSLSRNIGIDNAKGKYLYFIDADDFIKFDTIEYLYELLIQYDADISSCKPLDIHNYNFKIKNVKEKINILNNEEFLKKILLSIDRSGTTWNKLMKKEVFNNIRFENRIVNDIVVSYKQAFIIKKYVYSNQYKYFYLKNPYSILGRHKPDRAIDQYKASIERYEYIKKRLPNLIENDIGLLHSIVMVYNHDDNMVDKYLEEVNSQEKFNSLFSFNKLFKCKIKIKEKVKIVLYRINPKIERLIQKKYNKGKK